MTSETLKSLLDHLKPPILPPKVAKAALQYRFELDNGEHWDLRLSEGRLTLADNLESVDCQVHCSEDEFADILSGRHNVLTSFMRGDLRIAKTLAAGKALYSFLRYSVPSEATV